MISGLMAAVAALLCTALLAAVVRAAVLRAGARGRGARATRPPHLGGIAVAVGTLGAVGAGPVLGLAALGDGVGPLIGAAGAVALLGLAADLWPLGARVRIGVQTAAATVVVALASGLSPGPGALAVLWIVLVTNAFSLLDASDGAMGTVAAVTALGLAVCAIADRLPGLALLLSVLAASLTGFLVHNWHPARIVLGHGGSLFTGFLLASATVLVHTEAGPARAGASLFALTAVVLADAVLVLVSRRRAGRPLSEGGADHIAHRLRRSGLTVQGTAVVLGIATAAGTVTALLIHDGSLAPPAVLPLVLGTAVAVVALLRVPVYGDEALRTEQAPEAAAREGAPA
ncbi:MraY family glycosyltransferase [Streptomyces sp. NPDC058301]|uniref:MraY family glycosyltransferase n=1 Tax=Streptomyces sp. NPDC058301 TaxID=3346436 RepID=UPI0036ECE01F